MNIRHETSSNVKRARTDRDAVPAPAAACRLSRRAFSSLGVAAACGTVLAQASPALAASPLSLVDDLKAQAQTLVDGLSEMFDHLMKGDFAAARASAQSVADAAAELEDSTSGPVWSLAEIVPVYGGDVSAARTLVATVNDLAQDVLLPLAETLEGLPLDTFCVVGDKSVAIDMESLQSILSTVLAGMPTIRSAVATVNDMGELHIEEFADAVEQVRSVLEPVEKYLAPAETLLGVLPAILGANGQTRNYVVVAQNNVEIRSTGGFPGAWCPLTATDGLIQMGEVQDINTFQPWDTENPLAITDEERLVFGDRVSYIPGDMNYIPDFPRVGELWAQAWEKYTGTHIDGILATDPVFLQRVLELTGASVPMDDGTLLDGSNAAEALMHDVYWNYIDPDMQDAYFAEAAGKAFDAVLSNVSNVRAQDLLPALKEEVKARRLMGWFANEAEQGVIEGFRCAAGLNRDAAKPKLGVYLADDTWAKMGWYIDFAVELGEPASNDPAGARRQATVTLGNTMTWEESEQASDYVTGHNSLRRVRGDLLTNLFLFAPQGGSIENVAVTGSTPDVLLPQLAEASYDGLQLFFGLTQLLPGESLVVTFDVVAPEEAEEPLEVDKTPTCRAERTSE